MGKDLHRPVQAKSLVQISMDPGCGIRSKITGTNQCGPKLWDLVQIHWCRSVWTQAVGSCPERWLEFSICHCLLIQLNPLSPHLCCCLELDLNIVCFICCIPNQTGSISSKEIFILTVYSFILIFIHAMNVCCCSFRH